MEQLPPIIALAIRVVVFLLGALIAGYTISSAARTFILPRGANVTLTRVVFQVLRSWFDFRVRRQDTFREKDRLMALYAPASLLVLPVIWLTIILIGYMGMFWSLGIPTWRDAFWVSGSSLLTLGFAPVTTIPQIALAFTEATIGLGMMALLIAYLPTMYNAFSSRESAVALLEAYAGSPPSAVEIIGRIHRIRGLDYLGELWPPWEQWFAELEESHTSLAPLTFFRSPQPDRSWVTAASSVLDAASLAASTLDIPSDPRADLCIRSGYLALRKIAAFFQIPFNPDPKPEDPIQVTQEEFNQACARLSAWGVPLKPDRDQAWRDFAGWRVNYETVVLALAALTMAPEAPWSSDRAQVPVDAPRWLKRYNLK